MVVCFRMHSPVLKDWSLKNDTTNNNKTTSFQRLQVIHSKSQLKTEGLLKKQKLTVRTGGKHVGGKGTCWGKCSSLVLGQYFT